jgi:hypothetical protein
LKAITGFPRELLYLARKNSLKKATPGMGYQPDKANECYTREESKHFVLKDLSIWKRQR